MHYFSFLLYTSFLFFFAYSAVIIYILLLRAKEHYGTISKLIYSLLYYYIYVFIFTFAQARSHSLFVEIYR